MEWMRFFKKFIFLAVITMFFNLIYSQKFRVHYEMDYKPDSLQDQYVKKNMILDVNDNVNRFYSYQLYRSDSTLIANEKTGKMTMSKSMDYEFMVIKKPLLKENIKFYRILYDTYELKQDQPIFDWKILSEKKTLNNLICQKATLEFKGRQWEAWFSTELPYSEGPYIFNGLPGLIISMYDTNKNYIFNFSGLSKDYLDVYKDRGQFKSIKINKSQFDKIRIDYYNDPYKEVKAGKIMMNFKNEKGEKIEPNFNELAKYKQYEIKKNNNSIELSESLKYPD